MSGGFAHIERCIELQEQDVASAIRGRDETRALLERLAHVSRPNTGTAKVLLVYARMATTACDWIDGDLCVDIAPAEGGEATAIEVCTELGGGLRERTFSPMAFRAPLVEFVRAIERVPHLIAPLAVRTSTARGVTLSAGAVLRRTTAPPPPVSISPESLFVRPPPAARVPPGPPTPVAISDLPPADVDAGWDD